MYRKSVSYRAFLILNHVVLAILAALCISPLINVLAVSFSSKFAAQANLVKFVPVQFTLDAYSRTLLNPNFLRALWIGIERGVLGTVLSMIVISMAAYSLSKETRLFKGRTAYAWFFIISMLFTGGLIPNYLLVRSLGLANSIWALVLPNLVPVFSLILMMNFFRNIPKDLEESAFMDGAGYFKSLFRICLPLSLPSIATLSLFSMVYHWNSWFDGLIFIDNPDHYPLATFLQTVIVQQNFDRIGLRPEDLPNITPRTVRAAQVFIGSLPILMVYPFLQRYFVKGMTLGAVKE